MSTKYFSLYYKKAIDFDNNDKTDIYSPWNVSKMQNYNPVYSLYFNVDESTCNKISLNHKYHLKDKNTIVDSSSNPVNCEMYIKCAPLLDPIHYLIGKYKTETIKMRELPMINSHEDNVMKKILEVNNSSYVDSFFNYLSSQILHTHTIPHCIDFYGSHLVIQDKFKYNICDDIDYLKESEYFLGNNNKMYELDENANDTNSVASQNTQTNRRKIIIKDENIIMDDVTDYFDELEDGTNVNNDMELVFEHEKEDDDSSDDSSISYSSADEDEDDDEEDESEEDDEEDDSEEEDEDDEEISAYIYNFPVQMIYLEKCDGTLDQLLEDEMLNDTQSASALIQVIFTLIIYQNSFKFTHNDLHTNNIVYKNTKEKFLYYNYKGKKYKVPTYGRIFKIIDFGRSMYKYRGKWLCSDSFAPGGDAHGQYNVEPFFNENKPRIEPNMSFDLCRLGCSLYDFVFDSDEPLPKLLTPLQDIVLNWCKDDNGMNILYKKNGEERYPNFKLYKMIARLVHDKKPDDQLGLPFFSQFSISSDKLKRNKIIDLDKIPKYYA